MNGNRAAWLALFLSATRLAQAADPPPPSPSVAPEAPAASSAVPAAPTPSPAPAPASPPAPPPVPARPGLAPGEAIVHVAVNYPDAWLETRAYVDGGPFQRTCRAPCDLTLQVQGLEARVVAEGMTTSNNFRFDPGSGTAGVRVEGGSATARRWGIVTLASGIPLALAGMALFAQGRVKGSTGLEIAGIAGLAVGGVSVGISLPLLFKGTTHVKDAKGGIIALGISTGSTF